MSKAVYIEWLDHGNYDSSCWRERGELEELRGCPCWTLGWIVAEDKYRIVVAGTEGGKNPPKWFGEICILKNCILKRRNIKVPR